MENERKSCCGNLNCSNLKQCQKVAEAAEPYDSIHGTTDYIMTWDAVFANPSDVYASGYEIFSTGTFEIDK